MKLTWTDTIFSRAACMVSCVQEYRFLGVSQKIPRKITKNPSTQRSLGPENGPKGGHQGPRRPPGCAGKPPGWVPPPLVTYLSPYFYPSRENPRTEVVFPILIA